VVNIYYDVERVEITTTEKVESFIQLHRVLNWKDGKNKTEKACIIQAFFLFL
jgi:hypothetical protein